MSFFVGVNPGGGGGGGGVGGQEPNPGTPDFK